SHVTSPSRNRCMTAVLFMLLGAIIVLALKLPRFEVTRWRVQGEVLAVEYRLPGILSSESCPCNGGTISWFDRGVCGESGYSPRLFVIADTPFRQLRAM